MAATVVTLNDLKGHSPVACLFKCNPSNISRCIVTVLGLIRKISTRQEMRLLDVVTSLN